MASASIGWRSRTTGAITTSYSPRHSRVVDGRWSPLAFALGGSLVLFESARSLLGETARNPSPSSGFARLIAAERRSWSTGVRRVRPLQISAKFLMIGSVLTHVKGVDISGLGACGGIDLAPDSLSPWVTGGAPRSSPWGTGYHLSTRHCGCCAPV